MTLAKMITVMLTIGLLSCTHADEPPKSLPITLTAMNDFSVPDNIGLYVDNERQAIAIDAAVLQFRDQLMGPTHVVNWLESSKSFKAEFHYLSEKDGEPTYELWVNDQLLKTTIAKETREEFESNFTTWKGIKLSPADIITLKSNAVTNGKIPEGDGTAFARGRWVSLTLTENN